MKRGVSILLMTLLVVGLEFAFAGTSSTAVPDKAATTQLVASTHLSDAQMAGIRGGETACYDQVDRFYLMCQLGKPAPFCFWGWVGGYVACFLRSIF